MKRIMILLAAFSINACTANQVLESAPIIGNVCAAAQGTLVDEKVVFAAETIYNIPAQAYVSALNSGKITPELKAVLKPLLVKLNAYRNAVKAAKGTVNCDFNAMKSLQVQIIQLLPH